MGQHLRCWWLVLGLLGTASPSMAEPFRPNNPAQVLIQLPATAQQPVNAAMLRDPEQRWRKVQDALNAAYQHGEPRWVGMAKAWLKADQLNPHPTALLLRARAAAADHQFAEAEQLLAHVLRSDATHTEARLMRASLAVVQGRFAEAERDCQAIQDLSMLILRLACLTQVEAVTGRSAAAKQKLQVLQTQRGSLDPVQAQWIDLIQADLAIRLQDPALALQAFQQLDRHSVPALMLRADWLLSRGHAALVVPLLSRAAPADALLLRLAQAQLRLGQRAAAQATLAKLAAHQTQLLARQDQSHLREMAQLALLQQQPMQALSDARQNWQHQRESIDVVVYATAALRMHARSDLSALAAWLQQTGFEYPAVQQRIALALEQQP